LGRWKIQFCQAERRPKILVSMVSGPAKRRLASMPVMASGERRSALFDGEAHLVVPVDRVGRERDEAEPSPAAKRVEALGASLEQPRDLRGVARKRVCRR
jgi:hypothetical protein